MSDTKIQGFGKIKIRVVLKKSQWNKEIECFICTINGTKRQVPYREVEWDSSTLLSAIKSFDEMELESITITRRKERKNN